MLAIRVLTAVALLVVFLPILFLAPPVWTSLIAAAFMMFAGREWTRLLGFKPLATWIWASAIGVACALVALIGKPMGTAVIGIATAFWCFVAPGWLRFGVPQGRGRGDALLALLGVVVLVAAWWSIHVALQVGPVFLLSVLGIVWASDVAAYFAGRAFGRRKLAPRISPGKTWEGVAGAIVVTVLIAWIAARTLPAVPLSFPVAVFHAPWFGFVAVVVLIALGIVGDLFESLLKRRAGVKDSGTMLPGHGGVLDRIDALLPVLPAALLMYGSL